MATASRPYVRITLNGRDVTRDLAEYILEASFTDNSGSEADELEVVLEDTDGLWKSSWYPPKGATMQMSIGIEGVTNVFCGDFQVDELSFEGSKSGGDTVVIRAISAGVSKAMRTKRSQAHEGKTLKQVAEDVAKRLGLTLTGTIQDIRLDRVTQNRQTDLAFLNRLAKRFGYVFSVKGSTLVFTERKALETADAALTVSRAEVERYNFRDATQDTYQSATAAYLDPTTGKVQKQTVAVEQVVNRDGIGFSTITKGDSLELDTRAENQQQAKVMAEAALYQASTGEQTGSIDVSGGDVSLRAGINMRLTGFGRLSGTWHITRAVHTVRRNGGWTVKADIKRMSGAASPQEQQLPKLVNKPPVQVQQVTNRDGINFSTIQTNG